MQAANLEYGYDEDRFPNLPGDQFTCMICSSVVRNPKECSGCGSLFCTGCITSWLQKKKECPNRCSIQTEKITPISSKALLRIYNNLDIKCEFFDKCKKTLKLSDLAAHEAQCNQPKCLNYEVCQNNVNQNFKQQQVCELPCLLMAELKKNQNNDGQNQLKTIKQFIKKYYPPQQAIAQQPQPGAGGMGGMGGMPGMPGQPAAGQPQFFWSLERKGQNIEVSGDRSQIWLKETAYMFRTIVSDRPFYNGLHYWEIIADERTENELKIGVSTKLDFNYNSAFCDFDYGYSFYGLGQLRHNSNASGPQYGKRFKKEGVLGCFLNMNKGQLSYALNGEFMGIAFQHENLKKGPIVVAISLLHCAGCKLDSSKPIPPYFPK